MPLAVAFVAMPAQVEHQLAFGVLARTQYEQLSMVEYETAMMAACTTLAATVKVYKVHINTGRLL